MQTTILPNGKLNALNSRHLCLLLLGLLFLSGCGQNQAKLTSNDITGQWHSPNEKLIAFFTQQNIVIVKAADSPHTLLKGGWFVIHGQRLIIYHLVDNIRHWLQVSSQQPGQFQIANESVLAGRWNKISADFPRDLW